MPNFSVIRPEVPAVFHYRKTRGGAPTPRPPALARVKGCEATPTAIDTRQLLQRLQDQKQIIIAVLQQQQQTQTELQAQNRQLQQQMLGDTRNAPRTVTRQSSGAGAAGVPVTSLPEKAVYGMPLQQWRIWLRDLPQFAQI